MKKIFISSLLLSSLSPLFSQTQVDTCINVLTKADAFVLDRPNTQNTNYGTYQDAMAQAWTYSGDDAVARQLIHFDISTLPQNAVLNNAYLSLYYHTSPHGNGTHSGANSMHIQRVTSSWQEMFVTWNNKPTTTTVNQVMVPASTSGTQDYTNIDITSIIEDIITSGNNYGIMFALNTETPYARVVLASREEPNVNLHPKLSLCYTVFNTTNVEETEDASMISVYPNPTIGELAIDLPQTLNLSGSGAALQILDCSGRIIRTSQTTSHSTKLNVADLEPGIYWVSISDGEHTLRQRFIKN